MTKLNKIVTGLVLLVSVLLTPLTSAHATGPVIEAAKDAGTVGESVTGYLAPVTTVQPSVQRKIDEINTKRRAVYAQLADQQGQSLATIARLSGLKLIEREETGRYVYDDAGRWVKK